MVLTHRVGKERSFLAVVALVVVTFGIYGIYWLYKAHNEVFKQFEMEGDQRNDGIVWLILGLVFQPLMFVYYWIFADNVRYVRSRLGHEKSLGPGWFLGLLLGSAIVFFIGFVALYAPVIAAGPEATEADVEAAITEGFGFFAIALLIGMGLQLYAYGRLQADINGIWRAYDERVSELTGSPPAPDVDPYF